MADPIQDAKDKAWALDAEARQAWVEQDFTRSRQLFEQALEIFRSIDWKEEIIYGLLHVTQAMAFGPDYQPSAARPLLEEALQLAQDLDSARYLLPVQINRIRVMIDSGENAAGLALAQEYLPVAEKFADKNFICSMLTFVSFALVGLGLSEDALRMFAATEAEGAARELRSPIR